MSSNDDHGAQLGPPRPHHAPRSATACSKSSSAARPRHANSPRASSNDLERQLPRPPTARRRPAYLDAHPAATRRLEHFYRLTDDVQLQDPSLNVPAHPRVEAPWMESRARGWVRDRSAVSAKRHRVDRGGDDKTDGSWRAANCAEGLSEDVLVRGMCLALVKVDRSTSTRRRVLRRPIARTRHSGGARPRHALRPQR